MRGKKMFSCLIVLLALGLFLPDQGEAYPTEKWIFTGGFCWAIEPPGLHFFDIHEAHSPAVGEDGTIYVGDGHGIFFAISPNGKMKWARDLGEGLIYTPAIGDDGTIYTNTGPHLYALSPNDGTVLWTFEADCNLWGSPAVAKDGTIYIGSTEKLIAIHPGGAKYWEFYCAEICVNPVIDATGTVYFLYAPKFAYANSRLYAVNPNGTFKASSSDLGWLPEPGSPAIGRDGTIYVAAYKFLYALKPEDLETKWTSKMAQSESYRSSPVIGYKYLGPQKWENLIYVNFAHALTSFQEFDGAIVDEILVDLAFSVPAVGKDWMVYFVTFANDTDWSVVHQVDKRLKYSWTIPVKGYVKSSPALVKRNQGARSDFGVRFRNQGVLYLGLENSVRAYFVSSPGLASTTWPCDRGNLKRNGRVNPIPMAQYSLEKALVMVKGYYFPKGITASLTAKLESANQSLEKEDIKPAINKINSFINEVTALRGKKIPDREATALIAEAQGIVNFF
jgi:outer membrane protein assembly factor BamB